MTEQDRKDQADLARALIHWLQSQEVGIADAAVVLAKLAGQVVGLAAANSPMSSVIEGINAVQHVVMLEAMRAWSKSDV